MSPPGCPAAGVGPTWEGIVLAFSGVCYAPELQFLIVMINDSDKNDKNDPKGVEFPLVASIVLNTWQA